jgi:hypothetical protein
VTVLKFWLQKGFVVSSTCATSWVYCAANRSSQKLENLGCQDTLTTNLNDGTYDYTEDGMFHLHTIYLYKYIRTTVTEQVSESLCKLTTLNISTASQNCVHSYAYLLFYVKIVSLIFMHKKLYLLIMCFLLFDKSSNAVNSTYYSFKHYTHCKYFCLIVIHNQKKAEKKTLV